jgi:hypothetical protein
MIWIFAAVVLCLAVFLPAFRKVILVGVALLVIVVVLIVNSWRTPTQTTSSSPPTVRPQAPTLQPRAPPREIPVKQVEVDNIRFDFGAAQGNRLRALTARIYNNSAEDTLDRAEYQLLIEDCELKGAARCTTVDDEKGSFYLEVPPRQARDTIFQLKAPPWDEVTILGSPRIKVLITRALAK